MFFFSLMHQIWLSNEFNFCCNISIKIYEMRVYQMANVWIFILLHTSLTLVGRTSVSSTTEQKQPDMLTSSWICANYSWIDPSYEKKLNKDMFEIVLLDLHFLKNSELIFYRITYPMKNGYRTTKTWAAILSSVQVYVQ